MRTVHHFSRLVFSAVLTCAVLACCCQFATAGDNVVITEGVVFVEKDGTVGVVVRSPEGSENLYPSNGHGLLKSGQIFPGEVVTVKIVTDKGKGKHRGHVTVLK